MGFLDDLYQEHGRSVQQRVSSELGIPPDKAAQALPAVTSIVLSGLKRDMDRGGAAAVESRVQDLDRNGIPDDQELGGLLEGRGAEASGLMASQLGISREAAARLIPMLAPVIIGMLMKKGGGARGSAPGGSSGERSGGIASILDRNGDGSILDDLGRLISQGGIGLQGAGGSGSAKGGCLGILGAFLGGNRR